MHERDVDVMALNETKLKGWGKICYIQMIAICHLKGCVWEGVAIVFKYELWGSGTGDKRFEFKFDGD